LVIIGGGWDLSVDNTNLYKIGLNTLFVTSEIDDKGNRNNKRKSITVTSMLAASVAILLYVAVLSTINLTELDNDIITQELQTDKIFQEMMASGQNYIHQSSNSQGSTASFLNGITLENEDIILLFDSTPYASRGHIALNLPCDVEQPYPPQYFQVLVGRAPDVAPMLLGYVADVSNPPRSCVYHGQFGFGDPVTDVVLKNISGKTITLEGPHSVVITMHESFKPETLGFKDLEHEQIGQ